MGETVRGPAHRNRVPLPSSLVAGTYSFTDFADFLRQYSFAWRACRRRTTSAGSRSRCARTKPRSGCAYVEITLTIQGYGDGGDAIVEAVLDGFADAESCTGVQARLVIDVVLGVSRSISCVRRSTPRSGSRAKASSPSAWCADQQHPPEPYGALFREAIHAGLRSVPHAGRGGRAPEHPWRARRARRRSAGSRLPGARGSRVGGRGARAPDPVGVLPDIERQDRDRPTFAEHPFRDLIDAGLWVTLNSDDPAMFEVSLLDEYESARPWASTTPTSP